MYIIKIKGKQPISDYVQIRDDSFTLLAYFRADRPERALEKVGLAERKAELIDVIGTMPYGKIQKV
jgi:hypothetical protein